MNADALGEYACVVDLVYRAGGTVLGAGRRERRGSQVVDGLEILVRQGALSFERWTGRAAPAAGRCARPRAHEDLRADMNPTIPICARCRPRRPPARRWPLTGRRPTRGTGSPRRARAAAGRAS